MAYTLARFAADCHAALAADCGPEGRETVRQYLQKALSDQQFLATHLGPDNNRERTIIYEDAELGFCICTHVYSDARPGQPHDHGPTWAIYGQAEGETEMTDWRVVTPPQGQQPGKVERIRAYTLKPGDAHLYNVGDVHAPLRTGPTKLIRIEGQNTEKIRRTPLQAVA